MFGAMEFSMPSLRFLFVADSQKSLFKSITQPNNVAASFISLNSGFTTTLPPLQHSFYPVQFLPAPGYQADNA